MGDDKTVRTMMYERPVEDDTFGSGRYTQLASFEYDKPYRLTGVVFVFDRVDEVPLCPREVGVDGEAFSGQPFRLDRQFAE